MAVYLGISGGHHESVAYYYDAVSGHLSHRYTGPPINPHNPPYDRATINLETLLEPVWSHLKVRSLKALRERCSAIALALPGVGTDGDQKSFRHFLDGIGWKVNPRLALIDDTWAGLFAETLTASGVCAFAGSGASVFVGLGEFVADKKYKIDGWGPVIGDFGSGFRLMQSFFLRMNRFQDLNPEVEPPLFTQLRQNPKFNMPRLVDIQRWFDIQLEQGIEWKITFASLAEAITLSAASADECSILAKELVGESAREMAESIRIALMRFPAETAMLPIVFQGGMFQNSEFYRNIVLNEIGREAAERALLAKLEPCYGALLFAIRQDSGLMRAVQQAAIDRKQGRGA
jgi:N-acetylglucosamine kinase-like BadF-type ATPase